MTNWIKNGGGMTTTERNAFAKARAEQIERDRGTSRPWWSVGRQEIRDAVAKAGTFEAWAKAVRERAVFLGSL